jgi:NADH-quinone oxidoreductase subunit N
MFNLARSVLLTSPLLTIFGTALLVMMLDLFKPKSRFSTYFSYLGLIIGIVLSIRLFPGDQENLWINLFTLDNPGCILQIFILISVFLSIFFSSSKLSSLDSAQGDVLSLYLLSTVGMMLLVISDSMLSLYLSLELTSLPLYALVASQRNNQKSVEAAVKFFVMGAIASVFILFGMSFIYGLTGQVSLLAASKSLAVNASQNQLLIMFGLILIIAGASFKMALVPFHMWVPDVYVGANPVMTLFLSAAPKIAGLGIFMRLSMSGLFDVIPMVHHLLALLAIISIALGNFTAIVQKDLRRLLAYSTISHMGYAMLGFVAGGKEGQSAAMLYMIIYSVMTIIAFASVILPQSNHKLLLSVEDLKSLNKRSPWLAAMLMIVFFSMAGVPPAVGFLAKFFVIRALVDSGMYFIAIIALVLAVVGAFYYLNLIRQMYFESTSDQEPIDVTYGKKLVFMIQSLLLLGLGIFPNSLISLCMQAF